MTSMIFMQQSFTSSILCRARSAIFFLRYYPSLVTEFPYSRRSFLTLQSRFSSSCLLLAIKSLKASGCPKASSFSSRWLAAALHPAQSWMSDYVVSMSLSASLWISLSSNSIFLRNSLISLSFFITSTASPTYPPTCMNGVFRSRSVRKARSSIVSTLMEWSRCSGLQLRQKTVKACGQKRFMQTQLLGGTFEPIFSTLLCSSQITNDIDHLYFITRKPSTAPSPFAIIIIIFVSKYRMKSDDYQPADLNSIIKGRQSYTPKSSDYKPSQVLQRKSSEEEYRSLKSQYTTNYVSVQHPQFNPNQPVKNAKALRQEVNFIRNEQYPGEFVAYCIVVKESNLGIYSNERLIIFDSHSKLLSYYSLVPPLPINDFSSLPKPKENINIASAKKFSYLPAKNGIGEVVVSWFEGESVKEWRLTMSSRRVAKEFGMVIEQVRNNQHLTKRNAGSVKKIESVVENKVNKKQTPFIAQVKKLEESRKKLQKNKTTLKSDQIVNNGSTVQFSNVPIAVRSPIVPPITQNHAIQPVTTANQQSKLEQIKIQPSPLINQEVAKQKNEENLIKTQAKQAPSVAPSPSPFPKHKKQPQKEQIKLQQILKQAQTQYNYISAIRSPQSQTKRFAQLQNILSNRKNKQKYYRSSLNSHQGNRLSQKKPIVEKIDKTTRDSLVSHPKKHEERGQRKEKQQIVPQGRQSRYEDNYNSFRMSLLQERRQNNHQKVANKGQPKRQSARPKSLSLSQAASTDYWLSKWILTQNKDNLAAIYCKFVEQCQRCVRRLVSNGQNWHLLHKSGSQFHFQESDIDFHYLILGDSCHSQLFQKQVEFVNKIENWSYLLKFIHSENKVRYRVPLACVVDYKGLKVLCKAALSPPKTISTPIFQIGAYVQSLRNLEELSKIALHRCQLYEVIMKDVRFIYFNELDALPKIKTGQFIGSNYIQHFIKEGVIRNNFDIQEITQHISGKLIAKFLQRLNLTHFLSCVELEEILNYYGLNRSYLGQLYACSKENKLEQAFRYLSSELAAIGLSESIRIGIHKCFMLQRKDGSAQTVYKIIQLFLQQNLMLLQEIAVRGGQKTKQKISLEYKNIVVPYVISSTFIKLSLRCDFLKKIAFQELQDLGIDIWNIILFSADNVSLYFMPNITKYDYRLFLNSLLLQQNIFIKRAELSTDLTKQKIIAQICSFQNQVYSSSDRFKLLPSILKSRLNYYLSHYSPPNNRNLGLSYDLQYSQLYFTLYQHSSAYMQTHQVFAEDLIGIKWLIKRKKFEQADSKLAEQRIRVLLWGRHHPQVLMQINDLESLYNLKLGRLQIAAQRSLTALQLAIHFFGENDRQWQLIWEKTFFAADVNFQFGNLDQAVALYNVCDSLNQRIKTQQLSTDSINQQFLNVYNKKSTALLAIGKIEECIQQSLSSIDKLKKWNAYFKEKRAVTMIIKVDSELYDCYRLLLRNYQVKQDYSNFGSIVSQILHEYFQKDWNPLYLNNPKLKLNDIAKQRFSELIKDAWIYINKNTENINIQLFKEEKPKIDQKLIYNYIKEIRLGNRCFYRYTTQELFKYLVELVVSKSTEEHYLATQKSKIVNAIIQCLSILSKEESQHQRCRLYSQNGQQNKLLFLQSVTHLCGYEFCMGVLRECFQDYTFQF